MQTGSAHDNECRKEGIALRLRIQIQFNPYLLCSLDALHTFWELSLTSLSAPEVCRSAHADPAHTHTNTHTHMNLPLTN